MGTTAAGDSGRGRGVAGIMVRTWGGTVSRDSGTDSGEIW